MLSPLIREGLDKNDIKDFADAIEKVVLNIGELRNSSLNTDKIEIYDAVKAIDANMSLD